MQMLQTKPQCLDYEKYHKTMLNTDVGSTGRFISRKVAVFQILLIIFFVWFMSALHLFYRKTAYSVVR